MASDVAALVSEMNDTLVNIRQTIDALSTAPHTSRLDQLEHQRDSTIAALRANFERETDDLAAKRRRERDEITERRRQEDAEIAARRRQEDEDMGDRHGREDEDRERKFVSETDDVEDEMDGLMESVETEAEGFLAQGRDKLVQLEERRKELNRLIDEQVRVPLPTVTTRRRSRNSRTTDAAITSKPAPVQGTGEPVNNTLKAIKEEQHGGTVEEPPQQAGTGPLASHGEEDEQAVSGSDNASRGSFESVSTRRSRTASVSSSQRGSRMSAFGWIAGKIGLSETREEAEAIQEAGNGLGPEDSGVTAVPEVPERSPERPGGTDASKTPGNGQELMAEAVIPEVGEKDAALAVDEPHSANLPTVESVDYKVEAQVTTTSPTRAPSDGPSSPSRNEGHDLAPAHNEIQDPSPTDQELSRDARLPPENRSPKHYPTNDAQNELELDRDQYLQPTIADNEGNGSELGHDKSTASSRPESPVGAVPGFDGSETTLEVEMEHYLEQEPIQKAKDMESEGDFDLEQDAVDDYGAEAAAVIRGTDLGSVDDGSHTPAVPMETVDIKEDRDPSSLDLDQKRSPLLQTHENGVGVAGVDPEDVQNGLDVDIEAPSRSVPAPQELGEAIDAQSIPSLPPVMDEDAPSPDSETMVYEPAEQNHELSRRASEFGTLEQVDEDKVMAPSTHDEKISQTDEAPSSQYSPAEDVVDGTSEPAIDDTPLIERPEAPAENSWIELPPHAMEYSLAAAAIQLPNGRWPTEAVSDVILESLIAQFLIPSLDTTGHSSDREDSLVPQSLGEEKLSSPPLEDHLDTPAPYAGTRNFNDELVDAPWPSFAHDFPPVAVQLASGVWCIDPTSNEFEDAVAYQNAAASETHSSTLDAPGCEAEYSSEEPFAQGAALAAEPVIMQLPTGAWVIDPSEESYEIAPEETGQSSTRVDHVAPAFNTLASPTADLHRDISSEVVKSPSHPELDSISLAASEGETGHDEDEEQVPSTPVYETGNREGTVGMQGAAILSEQGTSENEDEHPSYGATQAASMDGSNLPWSPFNSRIPLSPEASPAVAVQSPALDKDYEVERDVSEDAVNTAGRHSTFGYGSNQTVPEAPDRQIHDIPGNPYADADMLNPTEAVTDTDSQNFVTPLQSAGMQSPQYSQDPPDTFHNAIDYAHSDAPHEEAAMTVHGQDELFDSDSMSEYEPDPGVDENGDPRANLGMPPQHHVLANSHADEATDSPNTAILQPAAEYPYQSTPEMPPAAEDNSDVSPMSLRESSPPPIPPRRGLAFSRHNPERPVTPQAQIIPDDLDSHRGEWGASGPIDSTPMSLVSHSTLSSSPDSPIRERMHEGREPAIQNSWSEGIHGDQHGHEGYEREYEATPAQDIKLDDNIPTPIATHMPESVRDYSPATPSPSTLIQKMRSIFENSTDASPIRSRPSSGIYNPPRPLESPGYDVPGERRKGGFLNEADDEVDERSALLGSVERH